MAALTSGNWTITGANASLPNGLDTIITPRKKIVNLKLTLTTGNYLAAGVTLPNAGSIGLVRNLDYYMMAPRFATASGRHIMFTLTTGHKLLALQAVMVSGANGRSFQSLATAITVSPKTFFVTAYGW